MAMLKESNLVCPQLTVAASGRKTLVLRLPVFVSKTIEGVEQMTDIAFKKNWDDITLNRPATFTKLDVILKNPAPAHVPIANVMTQIANFMDASLNMKRIASADSRMLVRAAG